MGGRQRQAQQSAKERRDRVEQRLTDNEASLRKASATNLAMEAQAGKVQTELRAALEAVAKAEKVLVECKADGVSGLKPQYECHGHASVNYTGVCVCVRAVRTRMSLQHE